MMIAGESLETIKVRVKDILAEILGDVDPRDIPEDEPLFDSEYQLDGREIDSLDSLKLAVAIANEYELDEASEIDYSNIRTIREIASYVHSLMVAGGVQ